MSEKGNVTQFVMEGLGSNILGFGCLVLCGNVLLEKNQDASFFFFWMNKWNNVCRTRTMPLSPFKWTIGWRDWEVILFSFW